VELEIDIMIDDFRGDVGRQIIPSTLEERKFEVVFTTNKPISDTDYDDSRH
jgi:hypothetical protein